MRPSMSLVALLLLMLLFTKAQGIRLKGVSLPAFEGRLQEEKSSPTGGGSAVGGTLLFSEGGQRSGTTEKRRVVREVKRVRHRLPGFHEDYYGPRNHKPKHH